MFHFSIVMSSICIPSLARFFLLSDFPQSSLLFNSVFCFLTFSLLAFLTDRSKTPLKTLVGDEFVICFQVAGPHSLPILCCKPAPMQRCSQEPDCERLMTFPPSNLVRTCIHDSAKFVVTLSISCSAFATSTWMSWYILGLISVAVVPP